MACSITIGFQNFGYYLFTESFTVAIQNKGDGCCSVHFPDSCQSPKNRFWVEAKNYCQVHFIVVHVVHVPSFYDTRLYYNNCDTHVFLGVGGVHKCFPEMVCKTHSVKCVLPSAKMCIEAQATTCRWVYCIPDRDKASAHTQHTCVDVNNSALTRGWVDSMYTSTCKHKYCVCVRACVRVGTNNTPSSYYVTHYEPFTIFGIFGMDQCRIS